MSEIANIIQEKCIAFGNREIPRNDYYLLEACKM